jgi:hypothetical protein
MKIAGYIHPIAQALDPNFVCGWFEIVANLLQLLRRNADCECMMIAGSWPFGWAAENGRALSWKVRALSWKVFAQPKLRRSADR